MYMIDFFVVHNNLHYLHNNFLYLHKTFFINIMNAIVTRFAKKVTV